jgi:dipeptidyl aminopeptidase/acylaminoacyl peptidase
MRTSTLALLLAVASVVAPAARAQVPAPIRVPQPVSPVKPPPAPVDGRLRIPVGERATPSPSSSTSYSGHGAESVPPEVLARFRAAPLPSAVTRRVQSLLDVRAPGAGVLSPDGKRLFFSWNVTGVRQVWRIDGPDRFPVQLTGGEDATGVVGITRDGKTLIISRDQKGEENPGLYLQSVEGGPLIVVQHKPKVQTEALHLSSDGAFLYFRANDVTPESYAIYRYAFATKSIEKVFGEPGIWTLADRDDKAQRLLLYKQVGSNMNEVFEFDEVKKALSPLFGVDEREDYEAIYGAGDDVVVLTPKFGEFRRLFTFDRAKKTWTPLSGDEKWDILTFGADEQRTRLLVTRNEGGYLRAGAFDLKTKKAQKLPKLPDADLFTWGSTTPDGRYTVFSVDPGTSPAESWVLDHKSGKSLRWHRPSAPEVDLSSFARASLESYPARDGTAIPAFVRRPAACQKATTPCPVIVEFHGGPESQTRAGFSARAQLFVDAGFIVVQPNVRGSDGYGKTWIHADDGPKRKAVVTDIEDAAIWAKKAFAVSGKTPKVGVFGGSYGGYSVLAAMTMFAGSYDAGVEVVGISNLVTFLENTAPYRRALRISEYGDPVKDRDVLLDLSPTTHVDKIKGPLLLIQGATDPRVPVGEALQMFEVMQKKKLGAEMIVFPDEGHGVQKRENAVLMLGHALAFFEKHLK